MTKATTKTKILGLLRNLVQSCSELRTSELQKTRAKKKSRKLIGKLIRYIEQAASLTCSNQCGMRRGNWSVSFCVSFSILVTGIARVLGLVYRIIEYGVHLGSSVEYGSGFWSLRN